MPETGGPVGPLAPQYLADQLTLFKPGRADYPHLLLLAPSKFFTFRGITGFNRNKFILYIQLQLHLTEEKNIAIRYMLEFCILLSILYLPFYITPKCSDAVSGCVGRTLVHPEFGVSVNPIPTRALQGEDYICHPDLKN